MPRRQGFTLIEMLVSMTLTIFVMVILSEAFVAALETFRQLKAVGDMEASLRTAAIMLRRDLGAEHFEGKRRLSDPKFWTVGPPREGFFSLLQTNAVGDANEGVDADGIPSRRRVGHYLHFTVKVRGNGRGDFFAAHVGHAQSPLLTLGFGQPRSRFQEFDATATQATSYNAQWAEVVYFLYPTGASANGTPLYALYRRQRLLVPDNFDVNWGNRIVYTVPVPPPQIFDPNWGTDYSQVSCALNPNPKANPQRVYFNSPTDLTIRERRFAQGNPAGYLPLGTGDDLLLLNVVSFDVRVLPAGSATNGFQDLSFSPHPIPPLKQPTALFDTWSSVKDDVYDYSDWQTTRSHFPPYQLSNTATNNPGTLKALQIILRVWDPKTEQTRQTTIVQDL
jgi:type II secretory pathway pseudopilin PulG